MISLDQVVLLQKKVEAAVTKINSLNEEIGRLNSENDALRRKCAELTNALADKTGLVSSLEAEQNEIEQSILKALDQLDAVEDSVLSEVVPPNDEVAAEIDALNTERNVQDDQSFFNFVENEVNEAVAQAENITEVPVQQEVEAPSTDEQSSNTSQENPETESSQEGGAAEEKSDINQFDIF